MNDEFWSKLEELYQKEDGNIRKYEEERPILEKVLQKINDIELGGIYKIILPIGVGGAGIVIKINDIRLNLDRALKIPRPSKDDKNKHIIESIENEIENLRNINHDNIIKIYNLGEIEIEDIYLRYPYFVMDYIDEAIDLKKKIMQIVREIKSSKDLEIITTWLSNCFYNISKALNYLHYNNIIHFDVKPENILIDKTDKPILSDLGFAKKKSDQTDEVIIGFTYFYAHPYLISGYEHMSSINRVRHRISPKNFEYKYDIYAFGKTLLEALALVNKYFPDVVVYNYNFLYMHLAACRMLDGHNKPDHEIQKMREKLIDENMNYHVYKETWNKLDAIDFEQIKYNGFEEITIDFSKLTEGKKFLDNIPEANMFYPEKIKISEGSSANFTERVSRIINHPIFTRLFNVEQLNLANNIYPSATHTRYEHSIGALRNCSLYIMSLYNDPFCPLFKQLMNLDDIKRILVSSLLHDIAQYPLAHIIGETIKDLKHENLNSIILKNTTKDRFGHTLKDIVESDWGWGITLDSVKEILDFGIVTPKLYEKANLKLKIMSSIINGPIDVDKLDYLVRDSKNCFLKYADLIDIDRLISNLTVIIFEEKGKNVTIGTYEKGQSAAESLSFARYLMFQSLYWHHTARAYRTMLKMALIEVSNKRTKGKSKTFHQAFLEFLGINDNIKSVNTDQVLDFIKRRSDEKGKFLIDMVKNRNYYKRILTIHYNPKEEMEDDFIKKFRNAHTQKNFQETLQEEIKINFEDSVRRMATPRVSFLSEEKINTVKEHLNSPFRIIVDCPEPPYGTHDKLRFIPVPKRLLNNYLSRTEAGDRVSDVWEEIHYRLMNIIAKCRVFCHPDIRDPLMAALGPENIKKCLKKIVDMY